MLSVAFLTERNELLASQIEELSSSTDIIVCQYIDYDKNFMKIPIPATHRHVGNVKVIYGDQNLVLSKVRLTSKMLLSLFPSTSDQVFVPPRTTVPVSSLIYMESETFSEPNETDAKYLQKLVLGESEYGVYLSEDYEDKYPNGQPKAQNGVQDPIVLGTIRVPDEYTFVDVVSVSWSTSLVFFQTKNKDDNIEKFHYNYTGCKDEVYQSFRKVFENSRRLYWPVA